MTLYVFGRKATPGSLEYYAGRTPDGKMKIVPAVEDSLLCPGEQAPFCEDPVTAGFSLYKMECTNPVLCGVNKDGKLYLVDGSSKQRSPCSSNSVSKMNLAGEVSSSSEDLEKNYMELQERFRAYLRTESTETLEDILEAAYTALTQGRISENRHSVLVYNIMKYL